MKMIPLWAAACVLLLSVPATAMTDDDCATMWKQADANNDGMLNGTEADRYSAWMRIANKDVPGDGTWNQDAFLENCKADIFTTVAIDDGAPLEGANSFTEGQAQDRILAAGYSGVSALTKDEKGIWRGTATLDGKTVNVAVDYKGNVVAG
ncbi:MAG TPA: hypothetical protein VMZ01_07225 [Aestuariivirga sp.]|nr:hypothetical protein [Aestuariivirga sp.]